MHTNTHSIKIIAYDGYRADVRPRKIVDGNQALDIVEIEDAWVETGVAPASPVIHGFLVRCHGGARYNVVHHSENGWDAKRIQGPQSIGEPL